MCLSAITTLNMTLAFLPIFCLYLYMYLLQHLCIFVSQYICMYTVLQTGEELLCFLFFFFFMVRPTTSERDVQIHAK